MSKTNISKLAKHIYDGGVDDVESIEASIKSFEKKNAKKEKDPNAPKKAKTSYMYFCDDRRAALKADNPKASVGDMSKIMGAEWKELSAEEKKPYEDKAAADKSRYAQEKGAYEEKEDSDDEPVAKAPVKKATSSKSTTKAKPAAKAKPAPKAKPASKSKSKKKESSEEEEGSDLEGLDD